MTSILLVLLLGCSLAAIGSTMSTDTPMTDEQIWAQLMKYGYIDEDDMVDGLPKNDDIKKRSVQYYQKMGNMNMTGNIDQEMRDLMRMPRCGMPDMFSERDMFRKKRFALGPRWPRTSGSRTDLTWQLINRTPDLDASAVDRIMTNALKVWSDVSGLTFTEDTSGTSGTADIDIEFRSGSHSEGEFGTGVFQDPGDEGNVLAHAFFPNPRAPRIQGDAHFDEDEQYTDGVNSGINLLQVAAHEFGHSLGLGHSTVRDAVMAPFYRGYEENFELHSDDIAGIQAHYGENTEEEITTSSSSFTGTPRTTTPTPVDDCMAQISWVARTEDGGLYFANDTHVFRREGNSIVAGYPRRIADEFPGLPDSLDAAVYLEPLTYFFKGNQWWAFENQELESGPRGFSYWGFLPSDIDSAFIWPLNGDLYFTKGNEYYGTWRWTSNSGAIRYYVPRYYYPQSLSVLMNLPVDGVDAAFQDDSQPFFIAGSDTYLINTETFSVADGYPKDTAAEWLGCDPAALSVGGSDASRMLASMGTVLFSALSALYYAL